jgi:hypothetical protein
MAKNVDEFKRFVEFVSNKAQSGNTVTPTQFNEVANRAQMQVFERDYKRFEQDNTITEFLSFFLKNKTIIISASGNGAYPSDYQHTSSVRSYYVRPGAASAAEVEVKEENNFEFGKLQMSQLFIPDRRFPKYSHFSTEMRFLPRDLGIAQMDYFKTPAKPFWNYTIVSNAAVYSASGSTNFEWDDFATNEVAAVYLSLIGCNLKDMELSNFAQMFKAEN